MELDDVLIFPKSTLLQQEEYKAIVEKIPLNKIATKAIIEELKKVPIDEKPLDLVFAVHFRESKNNRLYTIDAYKSIVNQILNSDVFIPVCFGHQSEQEFNYQARQIVGSVIGAFLEEEAGIVYYRIIPDASDKNKDIRRWLRNKQINAVSIWGVSNSSKDSEGNEVINDFILRSIDFVPPLTEGQINLGLVMGETHKLNKIKEYKEERMAQDKIEDVANIALITEFEKRAKDGRISLAKVLGEMSFNYVRGEEYEVVEKEKESIKTTLDKILEKVKSYGFSSIEELFNFVDKTKAEIENEKALGEFRKLKTDIMTEKGLLKDGKPTGQLGVLIDKYAPIKQGMNREEIKKVIDDMIEDKEIKDFFEREKSTGESINLTGEMLDVPSKNNEVIFEI